MNTLHSLVVLSIWSTTKARGFLCCHKSTNAHSPTPPHSPVEVQAVAGRPLLPHVYVLPHGAVTATQHRADSSTSQTHPQFGPRRCIHQRSPSHPLLTGQKLSAKHKLSKRWALADCSHHCCLAACPPASLGLHYGFSSPPSPYVVLGRATWLQHYSWPNSGSICKQMQFCFGHKITLDFKRRRTFNH